MTENPLIRNGIKVFIGEISPLPDCLGKRFLLALAKESQEESYPLLESFLARNPYPTEGDSPINITPPEEEILLREAKRIDRYISRRHFIKSAPPVAGVLMGLGMGLHGGMSAGKDFIFDGTINLVSVGEGALGYFITVYSRTYLESELDDVSKALRSFSFDGEKMLIDNVRVNNYVGALNTSFRGYVAQRKHAR